MRIDSTRLVSIKPELLEMLKNLEVGDALKGRVLEALGNSITIKTAGGQVITASLPKGSSVSKGAFVELIVKGMSDGKILAEFKPEVKAADMEAKLAALLKQLGLTVDEKNTEAAKLLLKYNLPVDKETVVNITGLKKSIDNLNQNSEGKIALMLSGLDIKNTPVDVLNKLVLSWSSDMVAETAEAGSEQTANASLSTAADEGAEVQAALKQEKAGGTEDDAAERPVKAAVTGSKASTDMTEAIEKGAVKGTETSREPENAIKADTRAIKTDIAEEKGAELLKVLDKLGVESGSEVRRFAGQVADMLSAIKNADLEALTYLASKEMEATPKNIGALISNIENRDGIAQFLDKLQEKLDKEAEPELKEIKEAIKRIFLEPRQLEDSKEVTEQLKDIVKLGERLESYLESSGNKDPEIREALSNLKDNIDFIRTVNEHSNFIQLPVMINGDTSTAKLYVFNEGKKTKAINPENATILLALDLKSLGHLESMIGVNGKLVNITFRVENKSIGNILESNSKQLKASLAEKGYSLNPVRVISLGQPFSLLSMEALVSEHGSGKIHFDMRV